MYGGMLPLLILVGVVLSGCATTSHPSGPAGALNPPWAERLGELRQLRRFNFDGRIAASNGKDGFSAGLRWQQNDDQTVIDLSAPLGFGAAHIQRTDDILRVTTNKGVMLESTAANDELRATLGFDPPLTSLRFWILGASDPDTSAQESVDAMQRLAHLEQQGWQVDYGEYALVQDQWLPRSLTITREMLRLKIVIHDWQLYRLLGD
jgi:outer membrane lipoprotein LolB